MGVVIDDFHPPSSDLQRNQWCTFPILPQQRSFVLLVVLFIVFQKNLSDSLYSAHYVYGILFSIVHPTHHLQGGDPYYDLPRQSTP